MRDGGVGAEMVLTVHAEQQSGNRDPHAHGELHDHRQQTVTTACQLVRQIFQRQGVHRREAHGVDDPLAEQHQRQDVVPAQQRHGHKQQADQRQPDRGGHQHAAIAKAVHHLHHNTLHPHAAKYHRDHHQPGMERREAHPNL